MKYPIDLHIHSKYSDGSDNAEELIKRIRDANIKVCSVTDHDTIEFYNNFDVDGLKDIKLITGIEFSCITDFGKCHILGYGFNPKDTLLSDVLSGTQDIRKQKLIKRLAYLEDEHKIVFSEDEREALFSRTVTGKPHIARILIKKGLAETISEAISKYLSNLPKGEPTRINAKIAIDTIISAGGVPVWAHPLGGENEKRLNGEEFENQLSCLMKMGIRGLECFYSRYDEQENRFLVNQASNNKLFISGGSDYHGTGKNIQLGELSCSDLPYAFDDVEKKLSVLKFVN